MTFTENTKVASVYLFNSVYVLQNVIGKLGWHSDIRYCYMTLKGNKRTHNLLYG